MSPTSGIIIIIVHLMNIVANYSSVLNITHFDWDVHHDMFNIGLSTYDSTLFYSI